MQGSSTAAYDPGLGVSEHWHTVAGCESKSDLLCFNFDPKQAVRTGPRNDFQNNPSSNMSDDRMIGCALWGCSGAVVVAAIRSCY